MKIIVLLTLFCFVFCVNGKTRGYWSYVPRRRFGDRRNFKVGDYKTAKYGNKIEFDHNLPYTRSSSNSKHSQFFGNNLTPELTSASVEPSSTTLSSSSTKELKYANIANDQKKRLKKILVPLPRHIAG